MSQFEPKESRRKFFQTSGRCLGLGALAALVIASERKRLRLEGDPNCIRIPTCADCGQFSGCQLPKARQFRSA